jgi:rSAM/selenodomain-associated transferase 2
MSKITVIIPVLNEADNIAKNVLYLAKNKDIEIIIVDGDSKDNSIEVAKKLGFKVIKSPQAGRAFQMNQGARAAQGEILLFLHADTVLPAGYQQLIRTTLSRPNTIAGAFKLAIDSPKLSLRFIETMTNWRSRLLSLPYGDQGIFLYASTFRDVGGFANLPIMEDFELIQRLKKRGKIAIVNEFITTSDRRWQKLGVMKTTIINQLIIIGYYLGVSPHHLSHLYGRKVER